MSSFRDALHSVVPSDRRDGVGLSTVPDGHESGETDGAESVARTSTEAVAGAGGNNTVNAPAAAVTPQTEYVFVQKPQRWLIAGLSLIAILSTSALSILLWYGYMHSSDAVAEVTAPTISAPIPPVNTEARSEDLQFSDQIIQAEADRLLAQAGKDATVLGNPCYGQGNFCPLWHYRNSANLRIQALNRLEGRQ